MLRLSRPQTAKKRKKPEDPAQYIAQGYGWVIDLDLEKFFDRVNHDKLMGQIAKGA
jgi:retron-type reverse transcriptase